MRFSPKTSIVVTAPESAVLLTLPVTLASRLSPVFNYMEKTITGAVSASPADAEKKYIKWADFDVTSEAMRQVSRYDVDTVQSGIRLDWISLPAYLGAKYGGDFSRYSSKDMAAIADRLSAGESMGDTTADMKYYFYYLGAYTAVPGSLVGTYQMEVPATEAPAWAPGQAAGGSPDTFTSVSDGCVWVTKYGLKGFFPIVKDYLYSDFDDFGAARSYGLKRQYLGHDTMGQVGTPVTAAESSYVEVISWNQYGGWRLSIRSFDGRRYYHYAHLRKDYPYHKILQEGGIVQAGDVIGYLGCTGHSRTENTNNTDEPHLHFGFQFIFDESQKEGNGEIQVNCYELTKFLAMNRFEIIKNQKTKEYYRVHQMKDPVASGGAVEQRYQ